jgi:hypothetical protein
MLTGTTINVRELHILDGAWSYDEAGNPKPLTVKLDGQEVQISMQTPLLQRATDTWQAAPSPTAPPLPTSFKDAFSLAKFVLVYPTAGTPEDNAAGYAKARFDAEQWHYRGNGSVRLVSDENYHDRGNVKLTNLPSAVLYGNADSNSVWRLFHPQFKHKVTRGRIARGEQVWEGSDLTLLAIEKPLAASVVPSTFALVGTTGPAADIVASRLPYFVSGAGIAPITLMKSDMLAKGWDGVLLAEQLPQE